MRNFTVRVIATNALCDWTPSLPDILCSACIQSQIYQHKIQINNSLPLVGQGRPTDLVYYVDPYTLLSKTMKEGFDNTQMYGTPGMAAGACEVL